VEVTSVLGSAQFAHDGLSLAEGARTQMAQASAPRVNASRYWDAPPLAGSNACRSPKLHATTFQPDVTMLHSQPLSREAPFRGLGMLLIAKGFRPHDILANDSNEMKIWTTLV